MGEAVDTIPSILNKCLFVSPERRKDGRKDGKPKTMSLRFSSKRRETIPQFWSRLFVYLLEMTIPAFSHQFWQIMHSFKTNI